LAEGTLQAAFDRNGNSFAQRFEALGPLRFNAPMERIFWEHWVSLAAALRRASFDHLTH
jgi:hypothetical protein